MQLINIAAHVNGVYCSKAQGGYHTYLYAILAPGVGGKYRKGMVLPAWKKMNTIDIISSRANEKKLIITEAVYHGRPDKK